MPDTSALLDMDNLPDPVPLSAVPPPVPVETLAARVAAVLVSRQCTAVTKSNLLAGSNVFRGASEGVRAEIVAFLVATGWLIPLGPRSTGMGPRCERWHLNPKALAALTLHIA